MHIGTTPGASQIGAGPGPEGADTGVAGLDGDEIHEKTFERRAKFGLTLS